MFEALATIGVVGILSGLGAILLAMLTGWYVARIERRK